MRTTGPARLLACLALATATALAAPMSASAAPGSSVSAPDTRANVVQPFEAKHSDTCLNSFTVGELTWPDFGVVPSVDIEGEVVLENPNHCAFIAPPTAIAHFTAYAGGHEVDSGSVVTLDRDRFDFTLAGTIDDTAPFLIDQVDVVVCHGSSFGTDLEPDSDSDRCGETVSYKR